MFSDLVHRFDIYVLISIIKNPSTLLQYFAKKCWALPCHPSKGLRHELSVILDADARTAKTLLEVVQDADDRQRRSANGRFPGKC